jgi:hypothetical protein
MAFGVALIGLAFFTQLGHSYNRGTDAVTPTLRTNLQAIGVSGAAQNSTVTDFQTCLQQRSTSLDPTIVPASCTTVTADPHTATVVTDALANANADDYAEAFRTALFIEAGILIVVGLGFLALPKHARMANALLNSDPDEDSGDSVAVPSQSAEKATAKAAE